MLTASSYQLRSVSKTFKASDDQTPVSAIHIGSLNIPLGGIIAIVGGSGSGKTTLLNLLGGLEAPDEKKSEDSSLVLNLSGEPIPIELIKSTANKNKHPNNTRFPRNRVSYIFQQGYLLNHASLKINLAMTRRAAGLKADTSSLNDILEMAKLNSAESPHTKEKKLSDRAITLSGGQQQRINIARAIGRSPTLLFADELTSSLDPGKASAVLSELRRWIWSSVPGKTENRRLLKRSMLWVTHDYALACEFADAVIVLSEGKIAKNCENPIELKRLEKAVTADMLTEWVSDGEVSFTIEQENMKLINSAVYHAEEINMPGEASEESSHSAKADDDFPLSYMSRVKGAFGNMASGVALSWMEAFDRAPASDGLSGNPLIRFLLSRLRFAHWVKAVQLAAVLALLMIITYGQREVIGYFDKQLEDPALRHVIVQQNSRQMQRSIIDDDSLAAISAELVSEDDGEQLAFGRFTESVDGYPKGTNQIKSGYVAELSIGILESDEPVYAGMEVGVIDPDLPNCEGAEIAYPDQLIPYADELVLVVSRQYLEDNRKMFDVSVCDYPYLDLWDSGSPRTFRIVGIVNALPADGYESFDAVMQVDVWRNWTSLVGKSQLSTYPRAAVYFTQKNYFNVMDELRERSFAFDTEIVNKFERLIATAAKLRNTFLIITWLSLGVAVTVAAGLIWGYLQQNAKSIAVLRAHDAWFWPLVSAIPFQLFLTYCFGLLYIALGILIWNALVQIPMTNAWIASLSSGTWMPSILGWIDLSPTIPLLLWSLVVMICVGWLCLLCWRVLHSELAHELRQAY